MSSEYDECSRMSYCQGHKRSVTAAAVVSLHCHEESWGSLAPRVVVFSWALADGGTAGTCINRQRLPSALELQRVALLPHHHYTTQCASPSHHIFYEENPDASIHLIDFFKFGSYEWAQVSSTATIRPRKSSPSLWYWSNKVCVTAQKCHCCTSEISWGIQSTASLQ